MPWASRSTSEPIGTFPSSERGPAELRVGWLPGLRPYETTWALQHRIHERRRTGRCPDTLLLLEHAPVVTVGRNASEANLSVPEPLLRRRGIDLVRTDRGGDVTYHGPGQLVGYLIVDLKRLHHDLGRFLREIEEGIIRGVSRWGIAAGRSPGRTGVWVGEEKLASIGLRASRWVTMHGFALNVSTDLGPFDWIVPCGIPGCRMTSMERLTSSEVALSEVGAVVSEELARLWGRDLVAAGRTRSWPI